MAIQVRSRRPWFWVVAVAGLGRSGMAAVRFLAHRGARVTASERKLPAELGEVVGELEQLGVMLECGGNRVETFAGADLVVVSPGVPLSSPPLAAARAAGVPVWAEVELAFRFLRGTLLGITGRVIRPPLNISTSNSPVQIRASSRSSPV